MPQPTDSNVLRRPGISEHWLAARVARRLVHRHGWTRAVGMVTRQRGLYVNDRHNLRCVTGPERWLYWTTVLGLLGKVPTRVAITPAFVGRSVA